MNLLYRIAQNNVKHLDLNLNTVHVCQSSFTLLKSKFLTK